MDDLIKRLRNGCIHHQSRWSGDTHDDLGGSIDDVATDALMTAAADALEAARRDTQRLDSLANRARVIQSWSRPDMLAIRLPDTLTADTDGLMLDVLRNAIDNAMGVPNDLLRDASAGPDRHAKGRRHLRRTRDADHA